MDFQGISRVFQERSKGVSRKMEGLFRGSFGVLRGSFKGVSKKFFYDVLGGRESLIEISMKFKVC